MARATLASWVSWAAPDCHAFNSATTWSICTSVEVVLPLTKAIVVPVYGSARVPESTLQLPAMTSSVRSRARMSLRVSHPFASTSSQAVPNIAVRS